jgi:Phosphoserine phosphatase RsbU, N-terminal domain
VTADAHERFRRDYAPAFLQYLSQRSEPGRRAAYELGRRAITEQLSVLDLTRIHHGMLLEVLRTHQTPRELEHIAQAASEFLVEALAVFEMTQRGGTLIIDQWKDQSATTYTVSRQMTAGSHELKVEYYENGGDAVAKVTIAP